MYVFHEVANDMRGAVLEKGLLRISRGENGSDLMIIKTDKFLDARCPQTLQQQGVSRVKNVYAYISDEGSIIDIATGAEMSLENFVSGSDMTVLRLKVDASRCFVSDLDTYDELKSVLSDTHKGAKAEKLAQSYWSKLVPLSVYQHNAIRRPEVMITYDVPETHLTACN